jgi:hypothetical protein
MFLSVQSAEIFIENKGLPDSLLFRRNKSGSLCRLDYRAVP